MKEENHMYNFKEDFSKCRKVITVKITDEQKKKIDDFCAGSLFEEKMRECDYQRDHDKFGTRTITGKMGECALENLFKKNYVDWNVGHSSRFNVADLKPLGLRVGIKTVEYGKYPIIKKNEPTPEIICIKLDDSHVTVCGLATQDVLRKYTDDDLILDSNLKAKGYKTGFYGFEHLVPFENLEELKAILGQQ